MHLHIPCSEPHTTHVPFSRRNSSRMPIRTPKIFHSKRTNTIDTNISSRCQYLAQKMHNIQQHTPHRVLPDTTPLSHHNTLAAPPPQTPRSLRYSQRSSNLTKRSHDSVGSMSIPSPNPPQTTAIEWTRTYYPACRSPTKPASRTTTADTICHWKEKTQPDRMLTTSPPHSRLTLLIEQPTNTQSN